MWWEIGYSSLIIDYLLLKNSFINSVINRMKTGASGQIHLQYYRPDSADGSDPATAQTKLRVLTQTPPLRVIRAFEHQKSGALVHLHNVSGGVLGGDQFCIKIDVATGAHGMLTTTGSNRIYRHRENYQTATQTTEVRVQKDGIFEYIPDSTIPYAHSRFDQKSLVYLENGAKLFWSEIINPGREGFYERFEWDHFGNEIRIEGEEVPILWEKWALHGRSTLFESPAIMGGWAYNATFIVCDCGASPARIHALEEALTPVAHQLSDDETVWGVSRLVRDGVLVRGLSRVGYHLPASIERFHSSVRKIMIGESLTRLRKIY